ncbi:MAG: choice-of-anchor L domain-containing protein [Flavobacteriales bacterium]|nr:choice-of-anchor L domain-containing protein [Flavobacteriales bacterium]
MNSIQLRSWGLALAVLCTALFAKGQLTVDISQTPEEMIQNLVGDGVEILNVSVSAADSTVSYYYSVGTELGSSEGLLMSTGNVFNAIGPNNSSGLPLLNGTTCLNCGLFDNNFPGCELLELAQDRETFDCTSIEFDIIPQGDSLRFEYTFASEEYNEWVGSPFNDVFGFFISGPNIGTDVNIALIPGTSNPVAINTVNGLPLNPYNIYYYNNQNPLGQFIQFDGFTINLAAEVGGLIPCETYHLTLMIADASDRVYDSGVFINAIESNPVNVVTATAGGLDFMIEECNDGIITFSRDDVSPNPQDVIYYIGGTATNGIDYTPTLGSGLPLDPIVITIPSNESSVSIDITAVADGITEGQEYITIYLTNPLCNSENILDSVIFYINDLLEVSIDPDTSEICLGTCVVLTGTAIADGLATFEWSPLIGLTDTNTLTPTACPLATTMYYLTSTVSDCTAMDSSLVIVNSLTLEVDSSNDACETSSTGSIDLTVSEGIEPYTYDWSGPDGFESDTEDLSSLLPGAYCVVVTDQTGCIGEICVTIIQTEELIITSETIPLYGCGFPISCFGECDASIDVENSGGIEPYEYVWTGPNGFTSDTQDIIGICAGSYTLTITDAVGCTLIDSYNITQPLALSIQLIGQIDVLCNGEQSGSATVDAQGGCPPYTYVWSHDPLETGPTADDLPSGTFTVLVSDQNGCSSDDSVTIIVGEPQAPLAVIIDEVGIYPGGFNVSCPNASDGYVNISISGGTPSYSVSWFNQNGILLSTNQDLSAAPCGNYTLLVSDENGCQIAQAFTLTCVPEIEIEFTTVPNPCADPNSGQGSITLTSVTGGHGGPYTFEYNGPSCNTCNTQDISNINSGVYNLIVTDALGCTEEFTITVGNNDLFVANGITTPASCFGVCDGVIDVSMNPAGTYDYEWYNESGVLISTNEDVSGLCSGEYTVQITAEGCSGFFLFVVSEPQSIQIDVTSAIPPGCFGQNNGSIDISVSGGSGGYTFEWSAPNGCFLVNINDEDQQNLYECCYTVVATDSDGCSAEETICLDAPNIMDIDVEVSLYNGGYNVSCNSENDGQISVFINGGTLPYTYDWSDCSDIDNIDENGSILSDLPAGTYCVQVFDDNGCLATTTVTLTEPLPIEDGGNVSDYNGFGVSCFGGSNGWIAPDFTGGIGLLDIDWITGNIGSNNANADTLFNLSPDTYTVVVTDVNFCLNTFIYVITEPTELQANLDFVQEVSCFGSDDASIAVSALGGVPDYTYNWIDEDGNLYSGNVIGPLGSGLYELTVSDLNGCTDTLSVVVNDPEPFVANITANVPGTIYSLNCFGDSNGELSLDIVGGIPDFTFEWSDEDGNIISTESSIANLPSGEYCVTITDSDGCTASSCYEITEPETPIVITSVVSSYPGGFNISCFGACDGSIDLTVSGGVADYTYQWNPDQQVSEDIVDVCAQFYEVLITDANGCEVLLDFDLTEPLQLNLNTDVSSYNCGFNVSCFEACDGSIEASASGGTPGYVFSWIELGLGDVSFVEDLCAGNYTVCVTDALDCQTCEVVEITEPDPLQFNTSQVDDCASSSLFCANLQGGCEPYDYTWSDGSTGDCITTTEDGDYSVEVTDSNGCSANLTFEIVVPEILSATFISTDADCGLCNGTYTITISGGTEPYNVGGPLVGTDLCSGTYAITITDANGCVEQLDIEIGGPDPFDIAITGSDLNCFGDNTGSVSLSVVGTQIASITWIDGNGNDVGSGSALNNLAAGTYTATWTDVNGCTGTETVSIGQPSEIIINGTSPLFDNGFNISVISGNDGSIDTDVQGGTPGYNYTWTGPATLSDTTAYPDNLPAGTYTLTVTDANGCSKDTTFILTQPETLDFPTGLSPNGDNQNDSYVIIGVEGFPNNTFKVFNRWGNLVYEKDGYANEWYGQNTDGEDLATGTYFVIFKAGEREFNSYVDLRR